MREALIPYGFPKVGGGPAVGSVALLKTGNATLEASWEDWLSWDKRERACPPKRRGGNASVHGDDVTVKTFRGNVESNRKVRDEALDLNHAARARNHLSPDQLDTAFATVELCSKMPDAQGLKNTKREWVDSSLAC